MHAYQVEAAPTELSLTSTFNKYEGFEDNRLYIVKRVNGLRLLPLIYSIPRRSVWK